MFKFSHNDVDVLACQFDGLEQSIVDIIKLCSKHNIRVVSYGGILELLHSVAPGTKVYLGDWIVFAGNEFKEFAVFDQQKFKDIYGSIN